MHPYWGPDLAQNPGMYPDWESNQQPFDLQARAQSTKPHQPGQLLLFLRTPHSLCFRHNGLFCCLKHARHIPASGPLHLLFPLPRMFLPQQPTLSLVLNLNVTSPVTPSLAILLKIATLSPNSHFLYSFWL